MKLKLSYLSVSSPLILENLKRFWSLSVLSFLGYFVSGIIPLFLTYDVVEHSYQPGRYLITSMLSNNYFPYMALYLIVPVVGAVVLYRFLHNSASVTMIHSLPLTRAQIFNSNFISGIVLIFTPLVLTLLILLVMSKPVYDNMELSVNVFSRALILAWFFKAVIINLFIYIVGIFSGIISGNTAMHMFLAFWFSFLLPSLYGIAIAYFNKFLLGFDSRSQLGDVAMSLVPYLKAISSQEPYSLLLLTYYFVLMVVILVSSVILYHKRKLERSGDSLVFKVSIIVISYLIAFYGMTATSFSFDVVGAGFQGFLKSNGAFYLGLFIGIFIFFFIGRMIVTKSTRVLNKSGFKQLLIYLVIALLFVASVDLDLTGFEKRVPQLKTIKQIELLGFTSIESSSRYDEIFFVEGGSLGNYNQKTLFTEAKDLEKLVAIHKNMISEGKKSNLKGRDYRISVYYEKNNGLPLKRAYTLSYDYLVNSKEFKDLYESKSYKDFYSFKNLLVKMPASIAFYNEYLMDVTETQYSYSVINNKDEIRTLMEALEMDYQERTWQEHLDDKGIYGFIELSFDSNELKNLSREDQYTDVTREKGFSVMSFPVRKTDAHTIKWMEDMGYGETMAIDPLDIEKITIYNRVDWEDGEPMTVTDKEEIKALIDSIIREPEDYSNYKYGIITFKQSAPYSTKFYDYLLHSRPDIIDGASTFTVDREIFFDMGRS